MKKIEEYKIGETFVHTTQERILEDDGYFYICKWEKLVTVDYINCLINRIGFKELSPMGWWINEADLEPDFINNPSRVITYVGEFDENKEYPYFEKIKINTGQIIC